MLSLASIISSCSVIQDIVLEELSWVNVKTSHKKTIPEVRGSQGLAHPEP